jgi:hypothetical protein
VNLLGQRDSELALTLQQPTGVDDRQADDAPVSVEAQHVTFECLFAVGRRLALADVQVEHVAVGVIGGVVEGPWRRGRAWVRLRR